MNPVKFDFIKEIRQLYLSHYLFRIEDQLDRECQHLQDIVALSEDLLNPDRSKEDFHGRFAQIIDAIHERIDEIWEEPGERPFAEHYPDLVEKLQSLLDGLEEQVSVLQSKERFTPQADDSLPIYLGKVAKKALLTTSHAMTKGLNVLRKEKKSLDYWPHTVKVRNLVTRHFSSQMLQELKEITDQFYRSILDEYGCVKEWQVGLITDDNHADQPTISSIKARIENFKNGKNALLMEAFDSIFDKRKAALFADFELAGTIEYANGKLSTGSMVKFDRTCQKKWLQNNAHWQNTLFALFEDWRSDLDIHVLRMRTMSEMDHLRTAQVQRLAEHIDPEIKAIQGFIDDSLKVLDTEAEDVHKELKKLNYQTVKKLDRDLVPKLSEKLSSQSIVNLINRLEATVSQSVAELEDEHIILKSGTFDRPLKQEEFSKISTSELVTFETLKRFKDGIAQVKTRLFQVLEAIADEARDLDHIILFSLSSAISSHEEGKSAEEVKSIAVEGFKRAATRMSEIRERLEEVLSASGKHLDETVEQFCESLLDLSQNENARELKLRITKAKATQQAEDMKAEINLQVKKRREEAMRALKAAFFSVASLITNVRGRFILTAGKPTLSKQVSDFLMESQLAMNSLPLIYRRLYQIEPLEDMELFVGRDNEMQKLESAYENWKIGRYGATALLGEKWGGLTSFVNYAVKKQTFSHSVIRYAITGNHSTAQDLISIMSDLLKDKSASTLDQLVDQLNNGPQKVIILEDLQNMYLKKVGGFGAMQALSELISRTGHNVFWVTTTTIHTWSYLSKTIRLNEYFSYVIELEELVSEQIIKIVWKRNRISGFNIYFEAGEELSKDSKFMKLDKAAQQEKLKQKFFDGLNEFARANVSMALVFWLLSTKSLEDNTITIRAFQKPELAFLKALAMDKVYILHALVLHDGLAVSHLSMVLRIPVTATNLAVLALLEDGILIRKGDVYLINPIIYRGVISLLKSKNLIH